MPYFIIKYSVRGFRIPLTPYKREKCFPDAHWCQRNHPLRAVYACYGCADQNVTLKRSFGPPPMAVNTYKIAYPGTFCTREAFDPE